MSGKLRFCNYGKPAGHYVNDEGGWIRRWHKSGTPRFMCPACQAIRRLPKEVLDRMAKEEQAARRDIARSIAKESEKGK